MLCGFLPRNLYMRTYLKKKKKKSSIGAYEGQGQPHLSVEGQSHNGLS